MRSDLIGLLLLCMVSAPAWAQHYEDLAMRHSRPRAYHEAVVLPGRARPAVLVAFRIPNPMLVFVRHRPGGPGHRFVAEPRVNVEVNQGERRVATQTWAQPHYATTFDETQRDDADLHGMLRFDLSPGTYTYRIHFNDTQARREGTSEQRSFTVPDPSGPHVGVALLVENVYAGAATVRIDLTNLGGHVPFGGKAVAVLPVTLPDRLAASDAAVRYTLRRLDDPHEEPTTGPVVAEGSVERADWIPVRGGHEALLDARTLRWPVAMDTTSVAGYLVVIGLSSERLDEATYVLEATLEADAVLATGTSRFDVHWRGKPYALYDADVALRTLHFVEDKETVNALRKGSGEAKAARLEAYWRARDPTPATPFNELMAEYYRRIDHAAFAFRTGKSPARDGLRTDRARIYVVHGPPDKVERTFPPDGGVAETWTYADGQRFVFWAATSLDPPRLQSSSR